MQRLTAEKRERERGLPVHAVSLGQDYITSFSLRAHRVSNLETLCSLYTNLSTYNIYYIFIRLCPDWQIALLHSIQNVKEFRVDAS